MSNPRSNNNPRWVIDPERPGWNRASATSPLTPDEDIVVNRSPIHDAALVFEPLRFRDQGFESVDQFNHRVDLVARFDHEKREVGKYLQVQNSRIEKVKGETGRLKTEADTLNKLIQNCREETSSKFEQLDAKLDKKFASDSNRLDTNEKNYHNLRINVKELIAAVDQLRIEIRQVRAEAQGKADRILKQLEASAQLANTFDLFKN